METSMSSARFCAVGLALQATLAVKAGPWIHGRDLHLEHPDSSLGADLRTARAPGFGPL